MIQSAKAAVQAKDKTSKGKVNDRVKTQRVKVRAKFTGLLNFRPVTGIFSQHVGPTCTLWANPVHFSIGEGAAKAGQPPGEKAGRQAGGACKGRGEARLPCAGRPGAGKAEGRRGYQEEGHQEEGQGHAEEGQGRAEEGSHAAAQWPVDADRVATGLARARIPSGFCGMYQ